MKRFFPLLLVFVLLFSGCTVNLKPEDFSNEINAETPVEMTTVKAVWMAYYELQKFTKGSNEKTFKKKISASFKELAEMGFNTVTVQVRPCADAFYRSSCFPSSEYCFDFQGADMPYDPLEIMCASAHKYGLKIEAWINPYRVSQSGKIEKLSNDNVAKKWYYSKKKKSNVYKTKNKIYFNPASKEVTKLIVNGVKEICENYSVDAIHFDDYFYPTDKKEVDSREYKKYIQKGGKLSLSDWRRDNISNMVKSVYNAVKSINKDIRFGISPASNIENDRDKLYADVEKWVSEKGYVDYICPQVYFGFKNVYQPFMFTVKKWTYISKCDMYVGLPLYKAGKADKYAAKENNSIINEFKDNNNIIARQITYLSKLDSVKGFYVFSYSSLFDNKAKTEVENMLKAMQSTNPSQENSR